MTGTRCAHKESISIAVRNSLGKVVMESVMETKASTILRFIDRLRGEFVWLSLGWFYGRRAKTPCALSSLRGI